MKKSVGISGIIFPNPVLVIGTYDVNGKPNLITCAWGGIASSDPAAISVAVRPSRYSYEALTRTGVFTVNIPSVRYAAEADFFGITSGRKVDKFATTGLTPIHGDIVDAPYIAEFPYVMECEVIHMLDLGAHTLFIGAIRDVKADINHVGDDGAVLWQDAQLLTFDAASHEYRSPGEVVGSAFHVGKKFVSR